MHARTRRKTLAASLALVLAGFSASTFATTPQDATDMGAAPASQAAHVTLILQLHNQAALEAFIQQTVTPGNPHFQQFLTTAQFAQKYGATDSEIAQVQAFLKKQGLTGTVMANHMAIQTTGTLAQFAKAFQAPIHTFATRGTKQSFMSPTTSLVLPASLSNIVINTSGLSTAVKYRSHRIAAPSSNALSAAVSPAAVTAKKSTDSNPTSTGQPGQYTVGDVADFYNINPLYKRGITGKGSTVALVTLANFFPSDAETYWSEIGLTTKPNRITQVHVDGGGAIDGDSGEAALDVEQSGGLAPFADITVYDAPNAGNGFTDAFMRAVVDNKADSISTSWGAPEIYNFAALNVDGAKPTDTSDVGDLRTFHQILMEAAAQGQSVFAATGDSGAYDTVRSLGTGTGPDEFSAPLTVDSPASDPYMTAAGGTTTPVTFSDADGNVVLQIKQESVWGWDYLLPFVPRDQLFAAGAGGGVSVYWPLPVYQWFTNGIRASESKQSLVFNDPVAGPTTLLKLPAKFPGRNLPDISLNADPETGYLVESSTDGGLVAEGGTSFVAPQLNGISALLKQSQGHRIGFWNPRIYLLQLIFGAGKSTGFNDIKAGDNWFYNGKAGYEQGSGIGTLNVANLDAFLRTGL